MILTEENFFVSQIDANNNSINVSQLCGIYRVNIITQEKKTTKVIIVK